MNFVINFTAIWVALGFIALWTALHQFFKNHPTPQLLFSHLADLTSNTSGLRVYFSALPRKLSYFGMTFFLLAFLDPHIDRQKELTPEENHHLLSTEGIVIYLVLDQSGSMGSHLVHEITDQRIQFPTKLELLKEVTKSFINSRPGDLLGLIVFARSAHVLVPLTLDHQALQNALQQITVETRPDQNATAIGYAIFKAAKIIEATKSFSQNNESETKEMAYDIKGSAIILVTDGFQNPHPADKGNSLRSMGIEEAAQIAKDNHIKLYMISIEPSINASEFTPHRKLMERAAKLTGGQFFTAEDPNELPKVYQAINTLEKSSYSLALQNNIPIRIRSFSLYPYLIFIGLITLFSSILLETLFLRKVP
jgi:Ca-activated chloride channel family protein